MNKQRKTIIVLLAVAMLALVIDRVFLGGETGPQTASANADHRPAQAPKTPAVTPTTASNNGNIVLARRLDQLKQAEHFDLVAVPNAFEPSSNWIKPQIEIVRHEKPVAPVPAFNTAAQFKKAHRLTAVLGSGERGTAIVEGKRCVVGRAINGWTLTTITTRSAIFERDGKQAELSIGSPNQPKE